MEGLGARSDFGEMECVAAELLGLLGRHGMDVDGPR